MQNLFWMFDRAGEVDPRDLDARTGFDVRRGPRDGGCQRSTAVIFQASAATRGGRSRC
jgi:hypothetical protein